MCWWLLGRIGRPADRDRIWLAVLFGFSTQILWVTTRGGVWHTGHLIATILTLACLIELWGTPAGLPDRAAGRRRVPDPGARSRSRSRSTRSCSTREPAMAPVTVPADPARRGPFPWRAWVWLGLGVLPAIVAFFAYNQVRFGTPLESGYALATLPAVPRGQLRDQGLFSLAHVPMNLDYFLLHLPTTDPGVPVLHARTGSGCRSS